MERAPGNLYSATGADLGTKPGSVNMAIWWDADVLRELLDVNRIDEFGGGRLLTAEGCAAGSRNAPMGHADVIGDWWEKYGSCVEVS